MFPEFGTTASMLAAADSGNDGVLSQFCCTLELGHCVGATPQNLQLFVQLPLLARHNKASSDGMESHVETPFGSLASSTVVQPEVLRLAREHASFDEPSTATL